MAEVVIQSKVTVSGLGPEYSVDSRSAITAPNQVSKGYQVVITANGVAVSVYTNLATSLVKFLWLKCESGTIKVNPCSSAVAAVTVGHATLSAFPTITAGESIQIHYPALLSAADSCVPTVQGYSSTDAISYLAVGT